VLAVLDADVALELVALDAEEEELDRDLEAPLPWE
jgi:hypothetical protein